MLRASALTILASVSLLILTATFNMSVLGSVEPTPYVDSNNQFSINAPSGWTVDSSGAYGTAVLLYGPTDSGFRINMNIIVQATSLSLSDYVSQSKSGLSSSLTNYQLVSEGSTTIGGVAAYELVNKFTQGSYSIQDLQDILVQNQKAYVITGTALQSNYGAYQPSFAESVQTFKVTGGAGFPWLIAIVGGVIAALVAVGLTVFFVRRKRRVSVPPSTPQIPPTSPPS